MNGRITSKLNNGDSEIYHLEISGVSPRQCGNGQYLIVNVVNDSGSSKSIYLALANGKNDPQIVISQSLKGKKNVLSECSSESKLIVKGPCGNEFNPAGKTLLICAGSAITIMRNLYENLTMVEKKKVSVIYSAKKLDDIAFPGLISRLSSDERHYISFTEEKSSKFNYGRITVYLKERSIDSDTSVFVCGPKGFEDEVVNILLGKSHTAQNIYISHYGEIKSIDSPDLTSRGFKIPKEEKTVSDYKIAVSGTKR